MPAPDALEVRQARTALLQASGRQKLDILLHGPHPRDLIQALPAQELYLTLLDIGLDDCAEVVALSSQQQFKHFIDAGCWPRSDAPPDPRKIMRWVTLAREGGGSGDLAMRRFHDKLAALDTELFSLLLRRELKVHDLTADEFPEYSDDAQTWHTPDRRYMVEFLEEGSPYAILKRLLDDLVAVNAFHVSRMLEALRWELPSELEETARRWRDGRMRDSGVPDMEEALSFMARPARSKKNEAAEQTRREQVVTDTASADAASSAARARAAAPSSEMPVQPSGGALIPTSNRALQQPLGAPPMLDRAVALLADEDRPQAEESIAYAANAALVAWQVPLDDPPELRSAFANARALLSLGLDQLSGGDDSTASKLLIAQPVRAVFQAAMGELYRLQTRARIIAQTARVPEAKQVTLLGMPHAALLDGLRASPPLIAGVRLHADQPHAPESRAEVARADALLDEAATLAPMLAALGIPVERLGALAEASGITPSGLRATDALRALILSEQRSVPFSFSVLADAGDAMPADLVQRLDARLSEAADSLQIGPDRSAARRMADRLRSSALAR